MKKIEQIRYLNNKFKLYEILLNKKQNLQKIYV